MSTHDRDNRDDGRYVPAPVRDDNRRRRCRFHDRARGSVLGRGFQAPSDTVNVAIVGIGGMGGSNTQALMSQNIVAFCDVDTAYWRTSSSSGAIARIRRSPRRLARAGPAARAPATSHRRPHRCSRTSARRRSSRRPTRNGRRQIRPSSSSGSSTSSCRASQKYRDYREMLEKQKDIDGVVVATPDHMHAVIASAAMTRRQARLRAEAADLVGPRIPAPGQEGDGQSEARHADGQPGPLAGRGAARTGILDGGRDRRRPRSARLDEPSARLLAAGHSAAGADDRRRSRSCSWNNNGVNTRLAAAMGKYPVPDGLSWDLFLGVAPEVEYHPIYHPFNWRGWVDWGQGALGDMGAHLVDHPVWGLELGLPTSIETIATPFNGATYPHATTTYYEFAARPGKPAVKMIWYDGGLMPPKPEELGDENVDPGRRHPVHRQQGQDGAGDLRLEAAAASGRATQLVRRADGSAAAHCAPVARDELGERHPRPRPDHVPVQLRGAPERDHAARHRVASREVEAALRRREHAGHEQRRGERVPDADVPAGYSL